MFQSTVTENFESWDNFLDAYYEPIRTALRLIPFVGESRADDLTQSFFLKMYERDILDKRPAITGKFRNWLYVVARRHAVDDWRKSQRRAERPMSPDGPEPALAAPAGVDDAPFDADEFYALSILHMTVARVRKHLVEEGKSEHWMIFEELVLAPLIPGRLAKTRDELLAMFPGQPPGFLDNRITTVKRVFRRILPALVPADPTENLTPEERFQELLEILHASKNNRLWLAFLTRPATGSEASTGSSLELAAASGAEGIPEAMISPEIVHDELRVLLGFWLEMPLNDYLDDLEGAGPTVARALKDARPPGPLGIAAHRIDGPQPAWADHRRASHDCGHAGCGADGCARTAQDVRETSPSFGEAGREKRESGRRCPAREFDAARDRPGPLRSRRSAGTHPNRRQNRRPERRPIPEERRLAAQSALAGYTTSPCLRERAQTSRNATGSATMKVGDSVTSAWSLRPSERSAENATVTALASSIQFPAVGQPVTLTATVKSKSRTGGIPTGSVTFMVNATPLGTVLLRNGKARLMTSRTERISAGQFCTGPDLRYRWVLRRARSFRTTIESRYTCEIITRRVKLAGAWWLSWPKGPQKFAKSSKRTKEICEELEPQEA